jgi:hypothetical protein
MSQQENIRIAQELLAEMGEGRDIAGMPCCQRTSLSSTRPSGSHWRCLLAFVTSPRRSSSSRVPRVSCSVVSYGLVDSGW